MTTKRELLDLAERVEGCETVRDTEIIKALDLADDSIEAMAVAIHLSKGIFNEDDVPAGFSFTRHLDAAKALHDAVLPGWVRVVDATVPSSGIEVRLFPGIGSGRDLELHARGDCENEAAAWVAAILRAKAEEMEE